MRAAPLVLLLALAAGWARGGGAAEPREWLGIPAGGLDVAEVPGLQLDRLVLTLSPTQVKATYLLVNPGEGRQVLDLGFPIPSHALAQGDGPPLAEAFSDAAVTQDGRTLELADVRIRVFMGERDVTEILRAAGVELRALANGGLQSQPRERARAMQQALVDAGVEIDPDAWGLQVAPVWRAELAPRSSATVTLTYHPYPGHAVDRLPGDELLEDLAHLAAYCADEQDGLLAWVRQQVKRRAEARAAELIANGQSAGQAAGNAYADIDMLDLSFLWAAGAWPALLGEVSLIVDPGEGRAAFCLPVEVRRGDDGRYRADLTDLPAEGSPDIMFLQ
jgi:hypothetical protein